jgi:peptide deformylase
MDPVLRQKSDPVENVDDQFVQLVHDMGEAMQVARGAGLAGNQVGVPLQFFVVNLAVEKGESDLITVINPIITASEDTIIEEEGCLSIPEIFADVERSNHVEIKGYDLNGKEVRYEAEGFIARAFQHEMEHLNGHLFWDNFGKVKRDVMKRKFKKKQKENIS